MIKNVTPLLKNIILSFNKYKEPTIRNILFHIFKNLAKKYEASLSTYHWYITYEIKRPHRYFWFLLHYFRKNKYSNFYDYRLRTFYLSVWLGHIIVDQNVNAFPEKFTFQLE